MRLKREAPSLAEMQKAGIIVPKAETLSVLNQDTPSRWLHIGPGNLFRGYIAKIAEKVSTPEKEVSAEDKNETENWGITAVVPLDPAELDIQLKPFDLLTLCVTLNPNGEQHRQVIAGVVDALAVKRDSDYQRLRVKMAHPDASILSFTITEKGYVITDENGELTAQVEEDLAVYDPAHSAPSNTMVLVTALLQHRYEENAAPITLISCDNFSHNGDKLRDSVLRVARALLAAGQASPGFLEYLEDETKVAFPISVIDKITPRPNESISAELTKMGFTDMGITELGRTPLAGFVNTEPTEYLIIENKFAGPRPQLEKAGVYLVEREVCDRFEQMKVTTCLNPLHTALAITGCLLGIPTIDATINTPAIGRFVQRLAWEEGLPVVVDPGIVKPEDFLREVLEVRFPNPYLPDQPTRIAMDTSQKLAIRFGETIKATVAAGREANELTAIALVFALWCRYLLEVDDQGDPLVLSSDPLLDEVTGYLKNLQLEQKYSRETLAETLRPLLERTDIFGVDLYQTGMAGKVTDYFQRLITGPGAVRSLLETEYPNA